MFPVHPDTLFQCEDFRRQDLLAEAAKARLVNQLQGAGPPEPRRVFSLSRLMRSLAQTVRRRSTQSPIPSTAVHVENAP